MLSFGIVRQSPRELRISYWWRYWSDFGIPDRTTQPHLIICKFPLKDNNKEKERLTKTLDFPKDSSWTLQCLSPQNTTKNHFNMAPELDKIYQFSLAIYVRQTNMKL
jgi:hypothetical protein